MLQRTLGRIAGRKVPHRRLSAVACCCHQCVHSQRCRRCCWRCLLRCGTCMQGAAARCMPASGLALLPPAAAASARGRPSAASSAGTAVMRLLLVPPRLVGQQAGPAPSPQRRLVLLLPSVCHCGRSAGQQGKGQPLRWVKRVEESCGGAAKRKATPARKGSRRSTAVTVRARAQLAAEGRRQARGVSMRSTASHPLPSISHCKGTARAAAREPAAWCSRELCERALPCDQPAVQPFLQSTRLLKGTPRPWALW